MDVNELLMYKRSALLRFGIDCFHDMMNDGVYTVDDTFIHHKVGGEVRANFGGGIIRHLEGAGFHCTPENMFDYPWAPLVCQLNHFRYGNIRATYLRAKIDDKLFAKFFKEEIFPIDWSLETTDPVLLLQLMDLATHLEKAGM